MASPQKENGFTPIANEILEQLVKIHLLGAEISMVFFVIRKTWGYQKKEDIISFSQFQKGIGISRMTISKTIKNLVSRKILVKTPLLGGNMSFKFNKDYDKWLVKTPLLVKSKWVTSKDAYTKTSKATYTHKRKKEIYTKERSEETSQIVELIDTFKEVNPSYSKFFANKSQRSACQRMLKTHGLEKLQKIIKFLPQSNVTQYMPVITTPVQLEDKFAQLATAWQKIKNSNNTKIIL